MNMLIRTLTPALAVLAAALIGFTGCTSTGIDRSKAATTTMQTMENNIQAVAVQLDAMGASLDELTKPGQSDVGAAFRSYKDNVGKIEEMERDYSRHADEMKARGADYFEEWQKDGAGYKNPQIQKLGDERRAELRVIYGRIAENSLGVQGAFKAYVSEVKEIQNYLSNDLTPQGIEAIIPISRNVVTDGRNLKYAINNVREAINKARAAMSQGGV